MIRTEFASLWNRDRRRIGLSALMAIFAAAVSAPRITRGAETLLPAEWADKLDWRCIGPANMMGRITSIAVYEKDPTLWWAASASGGLLKTSNNGITFEHQFTHEATVSIGQVAVSPVNPDIVWVGTGESNPRNSVSWGDGVYKSTDGGKTWKNMGLRGSFQIGAIVIHPRNPDIVYVGALGRLWGASAERGLYKTTDGGQTWDRILFIDDKTGVIEVDLNPADPETLLAATYERQRDGFDGNDPAKKFGVGSGIHRSTDGGKSWNKITAGLPTGPMGRIGIDWYHKDPNIVYAIIESDKIAQEPDDTAYLGIQGEDAEVGARLTQITESGPADQAGLKVGDVVVRVGAEPVFSYQGLVGAIRKHKSGQTTTLQVARERKGIDFDVIFGGRPETPEGPAPGGAPGAPGSPAPQPLTQQQEEGTQGPPTPFSSGLGGQVENVQDQQGEKGYEYGGVYRSNDGGQTFTRINSVNPRPMYYSEIRVDPSDDNYVYVLGTSLYRSKDGGKTFTDDGGSGIHVDHHALWVDPADGRHMLIGNDGGLYRTYSRMDQWEHLNHAAIGQFYHVGLDPRRDYFAYGGLQDNGSWGGPSRSRFGGGPLNQDWFRVGGGDGFVCLVDPNDVDQIYFESQNGGMGRVNLRTGERGFSRPRPERGIQYRFNWRTPFILSHHNSRIFYSAGNYVFRSWNQGNNSLRISPEITRTDQGSATVLAESWQNADVLYAGTDDGLLWVTRDGGRQWDNLTDFPIERKDVKKAEEEKKAEGEKKGEVTAPEKDIEGTGWFGPSTKPATTPPPTRALAMGGETSAPGEPRMPPTGSAKPPAAAEPSAAAATPPAAASVPGAPGSQPAPGTPNAPPTELPPMFQQMDANGDGALAREEVPERMAGMFDRMDADGDGRITAAEMQAARGRFGAGAPGRGRGQGFEPSGGARSGGGEPGGAPGGPGRGADRPSGGGDPAGVAGSAQTPAEPPNITESPKPAAVFDPLSGEWKARLTSTQVPPGQGEFTIMLKLDAENAISGTVISQMGESVITEGRLESGTGKVAFSAEREGVAIAFSALLKENKLDGTLDINNGMMTMEFSAERATPAVAAAPAASAESGGSAAPAASTGPSPAAPTGQAPAPAGKALAELLPGPRWVSAIETSRFRDGRVYVTLDGHRSDDDAPYVFVSEDGGQTWRSLTGNLTNAAGSTRIIREDRVNENLLYLGTEFGAWVSIDRGGSWTRLRGEFPTVAVHEFAIHEAADEVVAATHGRSLWVLDVAPLRQTTAEVLAKDVHLFAPSPAIFWRDEPGRGDSGGTQQYAGDNPTQGAVIYYALKRATPGITLTILDWRGEPVRTLEAPGAQGLNRVVWDLRQDAQGGPGPGGPGGQRGRFARGRLAPEGQYLVRLRAAGMKQEQPLRLERDPEHHDYTPWAMEEQLTWEEWIELQSEEEERSEAAVQEPAPWR